MTIYEKSLILYSVCITELFMNKITVEETKPIGNFIDKILLRFSDSLAF